MPTKLMVDFMISMSFFLPPLDISTKSQSPSKDPVQTGLHDKKNNFQA
jgi:hypothetical protein